jgi:hypothetical protein
MQQILLIFLKKTFMKNFIIGCLLLTFLSGLSKTNAWVYPEHREIMLIAIEKLPSDYRDELEMLWSLARVGYETRLSAKVIDPELLLNPPYIDYASWPAIAGDHSCSAENLLYNILQTDWIMKVADITAQLQIDLQFASTRNERINALRDSDLRLQSADPEYATRAGSNNVHFLLALPDVNMEALNYTLTFLVEGAELNAIGAYAWFHYSALSKASMLVNQNLTQEERSTIILSAFADEAFAIHFLEDAFAAGHAAGTWGDASQRKGTHDYYNEFGLKTNLWNGDNVVLTGDAWMRDEDAERASNAVRLSVEQFIDAAEGQYPNIIYKGEEKIPGPNNFDVCSNNFMPGQINSHDFEVLLEQVFMLTPVPALKKDLIGDLPRFRAEVGTFIGLSPALRGSMTFGAFGLDQKTIGVVGGLEFEARFGIGLDGVINESGDGLVFVGAGWRQDGSSSTGVTDDAELSNYGNLLAAIPGRSAFDLRLRLPFYVIPGDLLIAGPILFLLDQEALTHMAVTAVNGGLFGAETGIETSFGRFQLVLGREMAVYFFGRTKEKDALFNISPDQNGFPNLYILSYESTQFEFPILEYRPFRSFSTNQSSSLLIQLYGGFDVPSNVQDRSSTAENTNYIPPLKTYWYFGMRLVFDWRHYF